MGQKAGKKWTAAAVLQPTFLLPPTLLGFGGWPIYAGNPERCSLPAVRLLSAVDTVFERAELTLPP